MNYLRYLLVGVLFAYAYALDPQEFDEEDYFTSVDFVEGAEALRTSIPRYCGPDEMRIFPPELADSTATSDLEAEYLELYDEATEYWECTIMAYITPLFLVIASLLHCLFNCCCNCREKCCCKRSEEEGHYSAASNTIWFIIFLLFGTVISGFACVGMLFNDNIGHGIAHPDEGIVAIMVNFVYIIDDIALSLITPLEDIIEVGDTVNDTIQTLGPIEDFLSTGLDGIVDALEDLSTTLSTYETITINGQGDGTYTAPDYSETCTMCVDTADSIDSAQDDLILIQDSLASYSESIDLFKEVLAMLGAEASSNGTVGEFRDACGEVNGMIDEVEPSIEDFTSGLDNFETYRYWFTGFFFFIFFFFMLGDLFYGIIKHNGGHFYHKYTCMLFLLPLLWLLFMIHFPFALLMADSCDLVYRGEQDPEGNP